MTHLTKQATLPLTLLLLSLEARGSRGELGGNRGGLFLKLQLATTDFLDTILLECFVSSVVQVNTEHRDRIRYCVLADSFCILMYTCPNGVGICSAFFVCVGNASEPTTSLLQDLQGISNSFIVLHTVNISELDLDCK